MVGTHAVVKAKIPALNLEVEEGWRAGFLQSSKSCSELTQFEGLLP